MKKRSKPSDVINCHLRINEITPRKSKENKFVLITIVIEFLVGKIFENRKRKKENLLRFLSYFFHGIRRRDSHVDQINLIPKINVGSTRKIIPAFHYVAQQWLLGVLNLQFKKRVI